MADKPDLTDNALWKQRFRAANIPWGKAAPLAPERGIVCTNKDGIYQLYAWDIPQSNLRAITNSEIGVTVGEIAHDGSAIYYHQDAGGNELGHMVKVPFAGGDPVDLTPDLPPYAVRSFTTSRLCGTIAFVMAGAEGFTVMVIGEDGEPRRVFQSSALMKGIVLSADGRLIFVNSTERTGTLDAEVIAVDTTTGEIVARVAGGEGVSLDARVCPPNGSDPRVLALSTESGYERPFIWNPETGERQPLMLDDLGGDINGWDWSEDDALLLCQQEAAEQHLYRYEIGSNTLVQLDHPGGVVGGRMELATFTSNDEILTTWQDVATPSRLVALDARSGKLLRTVMAAGETPDGVQTRSVTVSGANDDPVQIWVATPPGEGPFPTILHTHGGPSTVQLPVFSPECQAWVDHGFAWISVNYHGSETFGVEFQKSIQENLGDLEVQDMAATVQWAIEQGVTRPDTVIATGGSYGGYLTLQALGRTPELWAGGMAVVAIADWSVMYEDEAPTLQGYQRALFGGTPEERPDQHRKSSPITYAADLKAPIMVIQGSNDTRCPARQMRVYEKTLKDLGKPIQVHWFEAGHGSRAQDEQIRQLELMLTFAFELLEGLEG